MSGIERNGLTNGQLRGSGAGHCEQCSACTGCRHRNHVRGNSSATKR